MDAAEEPGDHSLDCLSLVEHEREVTVVLLQRVQDSARSLEHESAGAAVDRTQARDAVRGLQDLPEPQFNLQVIYG